MSERIGIIGAGAWGMALAGLLADGEHNVALWEHDADDYRRLRESRSNHDRLPDFTLPESVAITDSLEEVIDGASMVVLATPAQFLRSVLAGPGKRLGQIPTIVNVAKGIEARSLKRMSEVITEETGAGPEQIVTVSGPSHAEEVVQSMPTAVVAASLSSGCAERVQQAFSINHFRVYVSDDLTGVELGGALKNVIALGTGIVDGLEMGDNTRGALITRGLAEITRLGLALGARAETFAGLSGIGDLVTTCTSRHSRNRAVGLRIGQGEQLDDILGSMRQVAEGVETTRSAYELARQRDVEVPITTEVYRVLFEARPPSDALEELMGRTLKAEIWR